MIVLFTDLGPAGPYVGQLEAAILREAPGIPVVGLVADAPAHNPKAAAYLLAALAQEFPPGTVFVCVVDPGVGGDRKPCILRDDRGRWYVGPDNGLMEMVARRSRDPAWWEIGWRPERLSATFHGRDLFAPVAARLALGRTPEQAGQGIPYSIDQVRRWDWPDDLFEIVYIDHFGNGITGIRVVSLPPHVRMSVAGHVLARAGTFSHVAPGSAFWYENSHGLAEIAVNHSRASSVFDLRVGTEVVPIKL